MAGQGQIGLHILRDEVEMFARGFSLAVNGLVLKACIHTENAIITADPPTALHLDLHAVFIGAKLDARNIRKGQNRPGIVGHMAVAGLPTLTEWSRLLAPEAFAELLAELTGPGLPGIVQGCKQERQKGHVYFRIIGLPVGCSHLHHSLPYRM